MKKYLLLLILLAPLLASSQADHRMSEQDKLLMPSYIRQNSPEDLNSVTQPPTSPVRASAEWEEIDALMIAWTSYQPILAQIVAATQMQARVFIICTDSNSVKTTLASYSIPDTNIEYIIAPFNSVWCRDYGQWNIYTNDVDSLALIDWKYNRPTRLSDDTIPIAIQNYTGLPMYEMTVTPNRLVHTGGNFMVDGFGTAFSSNLVLDENPNLTSAQVDTIMNDFMGINRYIKMSELPYDGIHHIDMHMKLLDEETILMGEYPAGVADGPQIEANIQYILANYNSVYGTPYKIVRIPMPPGPNGSYPDNGDDYRTYTNSVFVNNTVILPVYAEQYDTIALRVYHECLPGYNIVGIDCNNIIPALGAIHCITKEVAAADPLLISHQALHDTYNTTTPYTVNARIQHRSGIQMATLYYRTDTIMSWINVAMTNSGNNIWTADIPAQPANTLVYYYVEANSVSGKIQKRPMPAPAGYWKFNVLLNNGIEDASGGLETSPAFPNPSHGITCIPVSSKMDIEIDITLKNMLGQDVISIYHGTSNGDKKYFMNTSALNPGAYMLEIKNKFSSTFQMMIVK